MLGTLRVDTEWVPKVASYRKASTQPTGDCDRTYYNFMCYQPQITVLLRVWLSIFT
jgi:hypothetical protein